MKTVWSLSVVILLMAQTSLAEKKEVSFNAADGVSLQGSFYIANKPGPGVLLLHQCNADRQIYDHLGTMLSTAGYNVLAFDFRGFGGGGGQKTIEKMPADVDAALNFLTAQNIVNSRALGIVAGSCAVNEAVHAAQRKPEIRTLVLLSGGTDAEGEAYIKSAGKLPIFGAASEEDADAAAATKKLVALSPNQDNQIEMFKDAGHAASMFAKQPDLEPDIVIWFRSNLPVGGYGLPPAIK
jgi:pimeloyl-ACP methyl ester carboxylesterase